MPDNARLICTDDREYKTFVCELPPHVIEWLRANDKRRVLGVELRTPEGISKSEELKRQRGE